MTYFHYAPNQYLNHSQFTDIEKDIINNIIINPCAMNLI